MIIEKVTSAKRTSLRKTTSKHCKLDLHKQISEYRAQDSENENDTYYFNNLALVNNESATSSSKEFASKEEVDNKMWNLVSQPSLR